MSDNQRHPGFRDDTIAVAEQLSAVIDVVIAGVAAGTVDRSLLEQQREFVATELSGERDLIQILENCMTRLNAALGVH